MKWFKFYGQDYISDPKMLSLTACERSCWITLLAYSSINDNGMITFLSEEQLMLQANLSPMHEEWEHTRGVLEKFKKLEMITIDNDMITVSNWQKRQETNLTSYERVKRFRQKKQNDNAKITLEEKRVIIDNPRIEEKRGATPNGEIIKFTPKDVEIVDLLVSLIQKKSPVWVMKGNKDSWAEDINKIHRIDKRTYEQIEYMIKWVQNDSFWSQNILSASKLREKFNDLIPKLQKVKNKNQPNYIL